MRAMGNRAAAVVACVLAALALSSCGSADHAYAAYSGGDPQRGAKIVDSKNCGACHVIPGIKAARGLVGPPLTSFARRTYIAGEVANTPDNLVRWVMSPRSIEPHTAMPSVGLNEQQARDVAAFLYSRE